MNDVFSRLSDNALAALAGGLRSGRVTLPGSALQVGRIVSNELCSAVVSALTILSKQQFTTGQVAILLDTILSDRQSRQKPFSNSIELVTSGPEGPGTTNRDTAVVVRELFAHAKQSVMVVGYAVHQGQVVFEALARRMEDCPDLDVKLFLNVSRAHGDSTSAKILVARFIQRFKSSQWPTGYPLPKVYYDPRSIADDVPVRSSLHAKCVVVDEEHVFISSANFTNAAQYRNIEVGITISSCGLAEKLIRHFAQLQTNGLLQRAL